MRRRARAATTRTNNGQCSRPNAQCPSVWAFVALGHRQLGIDDLLCDISRSSQVRRCVSSCRCSPPKARQTASSRPHSSRSVPAFKSAFLTGGRRRWRLRTSGRRRPRTSGRSRRPRAAFTRTDACCSAARRRRNATASGCPSGGGPVTAANMKDVPFQPWARGVLADRDGQRARAAHALQAVRCDAPVPHALRRRVRRAARNSSASTSSTSADRTPIARSTWMAGRIRRTLDAELLRPLDRLVGRRHAGRRHRRLQRRLLARSARLTAHRAAAHPRALHAQRRSEHAVRRD